MEFALPMPPSVNAMFATDWRTKRRFRTKAYSTWHKVASDTLGSQYAAYGAPAVHRPVAISIRLGLNYQSDIANREKALTDLLVSTIDMPDDRYIDRIVIERDPTIEGAIVAINGGDETFRSFGEIASGVVTRLSQQFDQEEAA